MSVGFSRLGQYLQSPLSLSFKISFTRCLTNCFHSPLFIIQNKVVWLSSHSFERLTLCCEARASSTLTISFTSISAAISSNLGIDSSFKGATLVFEVNFVHIYLPGFYKQGAPRHSRPSYLHLRNHEVSTPPPPHEGGHKHSTLHQSYDSQ